MSSLWSQKNLREDEFLGNFFEKKLLKKSKNYENSWGHSEKIKKIKKILQPPTLYEGQESGKI